MENRAYNFTHLYNNGFPGLREACWIFDRFVRQQLPILYRHFEKEGVIVDMFATPWFLSVFSYSLPLHVVIRIWYCFFNFFLLLLWSKSDEYFFLRHRDLFLVRGWFAIHRVGVGLLKLAEGDFFMVFSTVCFFLIYCSKKKKIRKFNCKAI